jgi:hypothetical protein
MTGSFESHFEIKYLSITKPARKHFGEVAKKPILAHSGSKRMARLWHRYWNFHSVFLSRVTDEFHSN